MRRLKIFFLTLFIFFTIGLKADPIYKRTNNFYSYKDPLNEIGYGVNGAFLINEKRLVPELDIYYLRYFTYHFAVGICYGGIYNTSYSNSLSAKISFRVLNELVLSLKPGLYIKSYNDKTNLLYFFGFDAAYQFKLNNKINLGPKLEAQIIQDDVYVIGGFQMEFYF
jgi:hypothetical protein